MFDHARLEVACHARVEVAGTISEDVDTVGAVHVELPKADFSREKHKIRSLTPIRKRRDWVRDDTPGYSLDERDERGQTGRFRLRFRGSGEWRVTRKDIS
jgi:hypothetical protein